MLLIVFWPPKIEGHDVTGNRPSPWIFAMKLFFLCQNVELPSEHLSIFLQNTTQYFCRTPLSILADHLLVFLQNVFSIFKVELSPSKKIFFCLLQGKPSKNDEKCFLFHLKSSFRSEDIYIFVLNFWSCRKNGLIGKIPLISKFMTLQPG